MTPHWRGQVGPAAHRCKVELLDRGTDVIGVSCHKEVPGSRLLKLSTETMAMIAIFVRIICWNVSHPRAVSAGPFRHQLGPFLYILLAVLVWAVLVDTGRFGSWSGSFWRRVVLVHSLLINWYFVYLIPSLLHQLRSTYWMHTAYFGRAMQFREVVFQFQFGEFPQRPGKTHTTCQTKKGNPKETLLPYCRPTSQLCQSAMDMDWIHPWIILDWVGLDWVTIFTELYGLDWTVCNDCDPFLKLVITAAKLMLFLSNYDLWP